MYCSFVGETIWSWLAHSIVRTSRINYGKFIGPFLLVVTDLYCFWVSCSRVAPDIRFAQFKYWCLSLSQRFSATCSFQTDLSDRRHILPCCLWLIAFSRLIDQINIALLSLILTWEVQYIGLTRICAWLVEVYSYVVRNDWKVIFENTVIRWKFRLQSARTICRLLWKCLRMLSW